MIVEGIVTTLDPSGQLNVAPMGPRVDGAMHRFTLRPFKTSTTLQNLVRTHEGVFHVTDDALLLARAAIGRGVQISTRAAHSVRGEIITSACRYYEFRVLSLDDREDRVTVEVETLHAETLRDFLGWNRAKHAIVELAILATRVHILHPEEIASEFRRLRAPIEKTGGPDERAAYDLLRAFVARHEPMRDVVLDPLQ